MQKNYTFFCNNIFYWFTIAMLESGFEYYGNLSAHGNPIAKKTIMASLRLLVQVTSVGKF